MRKILALVIVAMAMACGCIQYAKKPCPCKPEVTVIAFTAEWCAPCKLAMPALLSMKADGINIQIVDVDKFPSLAKKYNIRSVPTYIVRKQGRSVRTTNDFSVVIELIRG